MSHFDVFNGDADGLCALHQLRLEQPEPAAQLVTGVKRDNALLGRVPANPGDTATVLDISLSNNREALDTLLERGVRIQYFDHHSPGEIPSHRGLQTFIDTDPQVCTSVLVDRFLGGRHRPWAVVGAFGDGMAATARNLAATLGLDNDAVEQLRRLGECLNYNAYGETAADQMYRPEALYRLMQPYADPVRFMVDEEVFQRLEHQYAKDLELACALSPLAQDGAAAVFLLPDTPWARRIIGSFAHRLAATSPGHTYAMLAPDGRGTLTVSLRVPAGAYVSADRFAARYGGNGRVTAAGMDHLPLGGITGFTEDFLQTYRSLSNSGYRQS